MSTRHSMLPLVVAGLAVAAVTACDGNRGPVTAPHATVTGRARPSLSTAGDDSSACLSGYSVSNGIVTCNP